jgi:hypothetical protein
MRMDGLWKVPAWKPRGRYSHDTRTIGANSRTDSSGLARLTRVWLNGGGGQVRFSLVTTSSDDHRPGLPPSERDRPASPQNRLLSQRRKDIVHCVLMHPSWPAFSRFSFSHPVTTTSAHERAERVAWQYRSCTKGHSPPRIGSHLCFRTSGQ